jgi:hypothetical protein
MMMMIIMMVMMVVMMVVMMIMIIMMMIIMIMIMMMIIMIIMMMFTPFIIILKPSFVYCFIKFQKRALKRILDTYSMKQPKNCKSIEIVISGAA